MLRQSPSRNQRSNGIKVFQICVLLAVCFWLIYQVKHSRDQKDENEAAKSRSVISTVSEILKFGRKDLVHPQVDESAKQVDRRGEEEEEEEEEIGDGLKEVEEDNKIDVQEEEEQKMDEDEEGEGRDDEIKDRQLQQEKSESEVGNENEREEKDIEDKEGIIVEQHETSLNVENSNDENGEASILEEEDGVSLNSAANTSLMMIEGPTKAENADDSSVMAEEKEARMDLEPLTEITTEGSNSEYTAAE